jgi:serine/threonine protein kinase/DNA-binding transcriptional ArsR family regulator
MPAKFIPIGEPAHDAERQGIRFLVDGLDERFTVYSNAWLTERGGVVHEIDAVVAAPHGFYVVELKSWRGEIRALDHDWYIPHSVRSPLKSTRLLAQKLKEELRRRSYAAGHPWIESFVFLTHTGQVSILGHNNKGRVHTRKTIIEALGNAKALRELASGQPPPVDAHAAKVLDDLLRGVDKRFAPPRQIREYVLEEVLDRTERYVEHLCHHAITEERRVLRVYAFPPLADKEERERIAHRVRWEAQVLARVAEDRTILRADPPFAEEAGMCLPFDHFPAVSLPSWLERHGKTLSGPTGLASRVKIWSRVARAIRHAHGQGVIHRMLRPDAVLVQDRPDEPDVRLTGFDLARQVDLGRTISNASVHDDRLRWAAPELAQGLSQANAQTDQFGLGVLLAFVLTGKAPFENTAELLKRNGLVTRIREMNPYVPQSLDDAVHQMLRLQPAARFPSLDDAIQAVARALDAKAASKAGSPAAPRLDPDDIAPGTTLEPDYEVLSKLGAGGLATVYAARHLVSGTSRALKVARPEAAAEEALRAEYGVLRGLDHPNVVRAVDLSKAVPDRVTLALERVKGIPLSAWIRAPADDSPETRRRFSEHLLAALDYLEKKGISHKDIKPDNLIVGDDGLTVIDFSLAGQAPQQLLVGTALYRDPSLREWSAASDRYSAALCLFELYAGKHAFGGHAPQPGEQPDIGDDDLDPPGLVSFFRRALHPVPERRFASAVAMRAEMLSALGARAAPSVPPSEVQPSHDATTALSATSLSGTAQAILRRAGLETQGDLVAMAPAQIATIAGLGNKKRREVLAFRDELVARGVGAGPARGARRPLWEPLVGHAADVHTLGLGAGLTDALMQAGFRTVGSLAEATRENLTSIPRVGTGTIAQIVRAVQQFADSTAEKDEARSLDEVWRRASAPLKGHQHTVLSRLYGIEGEPVVQVVLAEELGLAQPAVSHALQTAKDCLDQRAFDEVLEVLEAELEVLGGVARLEELADRVESRWPASDALRTESVLRMLVDLNRRRLTCVDHAELECGALVTSRAEMAQALPAFARAARQIARSFPVSPEAARRSLRAVLPEYELDPLSLASRLLVDIRLTDMGELFETPMYPKEAIGYAIRRERLPMTLSELREAVDRIFAGVVTWPDGETLAKVLAGLQDCRVEGDQVLSVAGRSVVPQAQPEDPIPSELLLSKKSPERAALDLLRGAARQGDGFRLVVSPAGVHAEVGRSVARALGAGAVFVSLEHELLARMEAGFEGFVRAEKFKAHRGKLTREAESLVADLLRDKGESGRTVVLGDTAILGVCDALHLVRTLYDEASAGGRGFWIMVVPGVLYEKQPMFLETRPLFHLESTLPILREVDA